MPAMMSSPFSLVPMRAELARGGHLKLDDGRKRLLEYAAETSMLQGRRTLIVGVRAESYFKGPIGPYDARSFAVLNTLDQMAENDVRIRTVGSRRSKSAGTPAEYENMARPVHSCL